MTKVFFADRVTVLYMECLPEDEMVVHQITLEDPDNRDPNSDTWAWCPDQQTADVICRALNFFNSFETIKRFLSKL